ncbi:unnamed protein product [Paramecium primaurelia]|uniref:EF-hand domain-containing protein n=1 Tax=Paramecium primaurelia TaxID=5886 RepID=A0A8S1NLK9_PARPR|nr:unnamed protein product [Paramecium primaurelia]
MDKNVSTKLKNFETVNWLKNRFKNQVRDKYILNDKELKEQIMMKAVFKSIDRDKSKFLDRQELYDMFKRYGINITKTKLKEFFKRIDQDEDDKLNWTDFKQALQNQEALQMFAELMRKIKESTEKKGKKDELSFIPLSFPNMIQYMNYCVLREELIQKINSNQLNTQQKVKQCKNLLSLEDICYNKVVELKDDENEELEEAAFIKSAKKSNDYQQLAILKRLQEKEQIEQRQSRIRKLSTSQYYKSETDQTNRSMRKKSKQLSTDKNQYAQPEFKLFDQLVSENHNELPPIQNDNQQKVQISMLMSERIYESDNPYKYNYKVKKYKNDSSATEIPKGQHFTTQHLINLRTPMKLSYRKQCHSPKRIRIISQTELQRLVNKS